MFKGTEIDCIHVSGDSPYTVISFGSRGSNAYYGKHFFEKYKVNAYILKAKKLHWWNSSEFETILTRVMSEIDATKPIFTYGASMGAYGALLAASLYPQITDVIAMSPLSVMKKEFEPRWSQDFRDTKVIYNDVVGNILAKTKLHLLYDPYSEDNKHVKALEDKNLQCLHYKIEHVGHNIPRQLESAGILSKVLRLLLNNDLTEKGFTKLFSQNKKYSPQYIIILAQKRRKSAEKLLKYGLKFNPSSLELKSELVSLYAITKRLDKSVILLDEISNSSIEDLFDNILISNSIYLFLKNNGKKSEVAKYIDKIDHSKNYPVQSNLAIARIYRILKNYALSFKYHEKIIEVAHFSSHAYFERYLILKELNQPSSARDNLGLCISLNPTYPHVTKEDIDFLNSK